ncbi:hypothetical protein ACUOCP_28620, partial [Escherichia sp. R-CC3]
KSVREIGFRTRYGLNVVGLKRNGVAQAWDAAMADAKAEDTVLVCGSFHTVAHVRK